MGPNTDDEEMMRKLAKAGMDIARFNFSHGDHEEQKTRMDLLKKVRKELKLPIAILLDTKGPEIRTGILEGGQKVYLEEGSQFTLTTEQIEGNNTRCSQTYKDLPKDVKAGDTILIDDGLIQLTVEEVTDTDVVCRVVNGGELGQKKGINVPNVEVKLPAITEQDKNDILFGIEQGIDFIAASFVRNAEAIKEIKELLRANGGERIDVIAKIENAEGVHNIDKIIKAADGVMVARGDLGVEIPAHEVPAVQKYLINKCRMLGKRVITATEMLESMIYNPRPTRAELSDVANAVYDGTSVVMLSGETASGKYPVEAVKSMVQTLEFTENSTNYTKRFKTADFTIKNNLDAVSHATCAMATDINAKCIVVNSLTGLTARMVSRFRCPVDILGLTASEKGWRKLNMSWGVTPVLSDTYESLEDIFANDLKMAKETFKLQDGDNVILTGGLLNGKPGNTNMIKVEKI